MASSKGKYCKSLLSWGLISMVISPLAAAIAFFTPLNNGIFSSNLATAQTNGQPKPTNSNPKPQPKKPNNSKPKPNNPKRKPKKTNPVKRAIDTIWPPKPKKPLGGRSDICSIAPGLIDTRMIWHDKPLFLWRTNLKNQEARLIVRERNSDKPLWEQKINIAEQKVFYQGQPLESGKLYQWKLEGTSSSIPWTTFQIMSANERAKIQSDLSALEQNSATTNSEEIALKKAEYFFNYSAIPQSNNFLWADALQALYEVEKPSQSFIEKLEERVANLCTSTEE